MEMTTLAATPHGGQTYILIDPGRGAVTAPSGGIFGADESPAAQDHFTRA